MFGVVFVQLQTFFVKFQIPPAAIQCIVGLTLLIIIPIYDRVFVPIARKVTGHHTGITMLQRIGIGLFVSALTMVVASLVETKRINVARNHGLVNL